MLFLFLYDNSKCRSPLSVQVDGAGELFDKRDDDAQPKRLGIAPVRILRDPDTVVLKQDGDHMILQFDCDGDLPQILLPWNVN